MLLGRDDSDAGKKVWTPPGGGAPRPLIHRVSWLACLIMALYLASLVYYLYVRIAFSVNLGGQAW